MRLLFFAPFISLLIWSYCAMFAALEIHPIIFKYSARAFGWLGVAGMIGIIIAACVGVRL